jgi:hypothetical protein
MSVAQLTAWRVFIRLLPSKYDLVKRGTGRAKVWIDIITCTGWAAVSGREWWLIGGAGQGAWQEASVAPQRRTIQRQNCAVRLEQPPVNKNI